MRTLTPTSLASGPWMALAVIAPLVLAGCSCDSDTAEPPTPQSAAAKKAKAGKGKPKPKPKPEVKPVEPEEPIIKSVRMTWPIAPVGVDGLEALQADVVKGMTAAMGTEPKLPDELPREWKCRLGTFFDAVKADGSDAVGEAKVRVFERLDSKPCSTDDAATEKWEFTLRYDSEERVTHRKGGGEAPFEMLSRQDTWGPDGMSSVFHRSFKVDTRGSKAKSGPFPHDLEWIRTQVGDGVTVKDAFGTIQSQRWAIAEAKLDGERVVIEYEQWRCNGGEDLIGAELLVRTTRKAKEHKPNNQLDVEVGEMTGKLGEALSTALGDRRSKQALDDALALQCKG